MNTTAIRYVNNSKYPIRFDHLRTGSLFRIHAEPSRGIRRSKDERVYRRALDHEGFFAVLESDRDTSVVLMPFDLVQPLRIQKADK